MLESLLESSNEYQAKYSLLSDKAIKRAREEGRIVIKPFNPSNLTTTSYDVTLGPHFYRETCPRKTTLYNIYSKDDVESVWGEVQMALSYRDWSQEMGDKVENISPDDQVILIGPGETILAHTNEFIGGRDSITTMMKARSSMGRNFIEVCKCAGWGDVGYVNRWTMEITNNSRYYTVPLVVGRRIAQIVFFDTEGIESGDYASNEKSKYQTSVNMEELESSWTPESMLPKLYLDREVFMRSE